MQPDIYEDCAMASLTIKNIPDKLYQQLKHAANTHHRSINSELIVCIVFRNCTKFFKSYDKLLLLSNIPTPVFLNSLSSAFSCLYFALKSFTFGIAPVIPAIAPKAP